jgi:hypothetical protein
MPFCTFCGEEIPAGNKFCEYCGTPADIAGTPAPAPTPRQQPFPDNAPIVPDQGPDDQSHELPVSPAAIPQPGLPVPAAGDAHRPGRKMHIQTIVIAILVLFIAIAAVWFFVLPRTGLMTAGSGFSLFPTPTPVPTTVPVTTIPLTEEPTTAPTPTPEPFPDAYSLKEWFQYNEGKYASKATVYRYWINDTYQWHNDLSNQYFTQKPKAGNKYLFVYVDIVNTGTDAYPYPKSNRIYVHYDGNVYTVDTSHYIPDKAVNEKATPIEVGEIEHQSDLFNSEFVEDYGYSHGTTSDFIYPGQSNAIDGYLIYEVPASLTADTTHVEIVFDGEDRAVWKLA